MAAGLSTVLGILAGGVFFCCALPLAVNCVIAFRQTSATKRKHETQR